MDSAVIGEAAPSFELADLTGRRHQLDDGSGKVTVLDFWSATCPWSERSDGQMTGMVNGHPWQQRVRVWRVAANADEDPASLRQVAQERGVGPILRDEDSAVADRYGAITTPQFFVIDGDGILRYAGAPDDSSWRQPEPTRSYLRSAIEAALRGETADPAETPGHGCAIVRHDPSQTREGGSN